jgi:hypothetical protein
MESADICDEKSGTYHAMRLGVGSMTRAKLDLLYESVWVMCMESADICDEKRWYIPCHEIGGGTPI